MVCHPFPAFLVDSIRKLGLLAHICKRRLAFHSTFAKERHARHTFAVTTETVVCRERERGLFWVVVVHKSFQMHVS